ncbi:MAG: class I SAM-dependent methyltransferase [Acidimicrobiales bacterium]
MQPHGHWTHHRRAYRVVRGAIPERCRSALDVGCAEGALTRRLSATVAEVTGVDPDEATIAAARSHRGSAGISYLVGDVLTVALVPGSFDLVTAVASLHHMDVERALGRLRDLVAPSGVLVVVERATPGRHDHTHRHAQGDPGAARPPRPDVDLRRAASDLGAEFRQHRFGYSSLVWHKVVD